MNNTPNDFVMVPVPSHRVQEVYSLLGSASSANEQAPELTMTASADEWTDSLIRRLYMESADNARTFLRLLAEAGGAEVSTNEIAAQMGLPKGASSVAGMTGALGRRIASRYQMDAVPWNARWRHIDPKDPTKGTETMLSLPKWMGEIILAL